MTIIVRTAGYEDAEAIAAVNLAAWEVAYRGLINDRFLDAASLAERAGRWRRLISEARGSVLVADDGDGVIGYCSLAMPSRDGDAGAGVAELAAIYVSPIAFRGGVGTALLSTALERLADFVEVTLWVLTANTRARAFYARHGFAPDGAIQFLEDLEAEEIRLRRRV